MLYSTYISQLRSQCGDTARRVHVDWIGDAATTAFQMPADTFPVLDQASTYVVKLAGATQTETTNYTLDKETGLLTMVVAPGSGVALTIDAYAVYLLDATWLIVINNVIKSLGDDFWKEFVDEANFTTTANMRSISLVASQPNCIAVYDFWHRTSTSEDWLTVDSFANWRYDRENNIIYIGSRETFTITGQVLKVRGLKTYTLGTATTDTLDVQDRFFTILEYGSLSRYWKYRYKSVVELVSKMTTESSRTPLQELIMLSDRFQRDYELEKVKLKPAKPPRRIPTFSEGKGRP